VAAGEVFRKTVVKWHCANCGYIHEGTEAPGECPDGKHEQAYYEFLAELLTFMKKLYIYLYKN
jgi:rubrerythrin